MGSAVIAECPCGLRAKIMIGGGMADFMITCYFPCACDHCHRVVQVNLLDDPLRCPRCRAPDPLPYDDPRLAGTPGDDAVAEWNMDDSLGRVLVLTDGTYRCPKGGEKALRFADAGLCFD